MELLYHSSGIGNYTTFLPETEHIQQALEMNTKSIASRLLINRSNDVVWSLYNYDLLADMIEKVSSSSVESFMQEMLFQALALNNAAFEKLEHAWQMFVVNDYFNYSYSAARFSPYTRYNEGSRGLHISSEDLTTLMYHLLNSQNFLHTKASHAPKLEDTYSYVMGWDVLRNPSGDFQCFKHSDYGGFSSYMMMDISSNLGLCILSNIKSDFSLQEISRDFLAYLKGTGSLKYKKPTHLLLGEIYKRTGSVEQVKNEFI